MMYCDLIFPWFHYLRLKIEGFKGVLLEPLEQGIRFKKEILVNAVGVVQL